MKIAGLEVGRPYREPKLCSMTGCDGPHYGLGRCEWHYNKMNQGEHILRKALKSDNLCLANMSPALESNLISLVRALPGKKGL